MPLDPARTVAELAELRELTGDAEGAQRVAWTETWEQRPRLAARASSPRPGAREEIDEAGNQWFTLGEGEPGAPDRRPPRLGPERRLARRLA